MAVASLDRFDDTHVEGLEDRGTVRWQEDAFDERRSFIQIDRMGRAIVEDQVNHLLLINEVLNFWNEDVEIPVPTDGCCHPRVLLSSVWQRAPAVRVEADRVDGLADDEGWYPDGP